MNRVRVTKKRTCGNVVKRLTYLRHPTETWAHMAWRDIPALVGWFGAVSLMLVGKRQETSFTHGVATFRPNVRNLHEMV